MPERKRPAADPPAPPIPDGGLGEAMPEWLRRPPAWRAAQPVAPPTRELPPPDESEIDPATLLTVEDLPEWLKSLANPRHMPRLVAARPPATPERRVIPRVIEATPRPTAPEPPAAVEPGETGTEAAAGETSGSAPRPEAQSGHEAHAQSNAAIVLGTLLGVAVVAIVVLLVLLLT